VTSLLEHLGLAPYALALPCVAGLAGAAVAAAHESLVSHVIGVQTPGLEGAKRWAHRVDRNRVLRRAGVGQAVVLATRKRVAQAWFDVAVADRARRPEFVAATHRAFRAGATYPLATALQALEHEAALARPPQPALLVWGERDRTHRDPRRDELSPGSRVVVFPGAAHFPDLEDVPTFAREVTRFLGGS
jgi:pimeloyl-ACP methyl ester carboxylesterase